MNLSLLSKYSDGDNINITAMFERYDEIERLNWETRDLNPYDPKALEVSSLNNEYHDLQGIFLELGYKCENCKNWNNGKCQLYKGNRYFLKTNFCTKFE
jgi:hypothetical protein